MSHVAWWWLLVTFAVGFLTGIVFLVACLAISEKEGSEDEQRTESAEDRPPMPVAPPNELIREDDIGPATRPTARRVGNGDVWEIRVPGRWWGKEKVYRGERTVWHRYPYGTRAGTSLESWLCDIWQVAVWKEEEAKKAV